MGLQGQGTWTGNSWWDRLRIEGPHACCAQQVGQNMQGLTVCSAHLRAGQLPPELLADLPRVATRSMLPPRFGWHGCSGSNDESQHSQLFPELLPTLNLMILTNWNIQDSSAALKCKVFLTTLDGAG